MCCETPPWSAQKVRRSPSSCGSVGEQAQLTDQPFQIAAGCGRDGHQRQTVVLRDAAHHGEHGLDRTRTGLPEVCLHQAEELAVDFAARSTQSLESAAATICVISAGI